MYQKLDRHLQCAIKFTKFLRNYPANNRSFIWMDFVLNDYEQLKYFVETFVMSS